MPATLNIPLPEQFERDIKQEMKVAALEAFHETAGRHHWAEYLQRKDAAEYLGISTGTLDKLTRMGAPTIIIGGLKVYRKASLDKWMLSHEI